MDKRAFLADRQSVDDGLLRRVRVRTRGVAEPQVVASVDPLASGSPDKSTDIIKIITARFASHKQTQDNGEFGQSLDGKAVLYAHPKYKALLEGCYSLEVGGTGREWTKVSPPEFDDQRIELRVFLQVSA